MAKKKRYLVIMEQLDDESIIKSMTGDKIREYVKKNGSQDGLAIIEGNLLKGFAAIMDITKL